MDGTRFRGIMESSDPRQRMRAAFMIGRKRYPAGTAVLEQLLNDPVEPVRRAAVRSISRLRGEYVPLLIQLIREGDSRAVMQEAVRAVAVSGNPEALEELASLFARLPGSTRAVLIEALYRAGWRRTELLRQALEDKVAAVRIAALGRAGDFGSGNILAIIRDSVYDSCAAVRVAALNVLSDCGDGDTVELFMAATRDGHPRVRAAACRALQALRDDSCLAALAGCLEDSRSEVRIAAVEALGAMASDESCRYLRTALSDPHEFVRTAAAAALEKNGLRTPEGLVALGDRVLGAGDEERAVDLWRAALEESPFCAAAYLRLGDFWSRKGELNEASSCYLRACEIDPAGREALLGLARCEMQAAEYKAAANLLKNILADRPEDVEAHRLMGECNLALGRLTLSMSHFRTCRGMFPEDPRVLAGLGRVYLKKRLWRQALAFLKQAVGIDETTPVWREIGDALIRLGEHGEAEGCFWRALELDPDDRPSLIRLTRLIPTCRQESIRVEKALRAALARSGDPVLAFLLTRRIEDSERLIEAIEILEGQVNEGGCPAYIHYNLARLYFKNGCLAESRRHGEAALKMDPAMAAVRKLLARICESQQRPADAVAALKPVVREHPDDIDLLEKTAGLALSAGDRGEVIWCLERVLARDPGRVDLRRILARTLMLDEKYQEALCHLEEALRAHPENRDSKLEMATCLKALGRYSEAVDIISGEPDAPSPVDREASLLLADLLDREGNIDRSASVLARVEAAFPDDIDVIRRRGVVLLAREEWSAAGKVFARLLEHVSDDAEGHYGYARALKALGKADRARQHFLRAAHLRPDDPAAWFEAGELARSAGDLATAKQYLSRAFALGMETASLLISFGEVKEAEGAFEEALSLYRKAMRVAPERGIPYLGVSRVLCNLDRCEEGLELLLTGVKKSGDEYSRGTLAREAGRILMGLGRRGEAAFYLREAVVRNDNDGLAHYELGVVCHEDDMMDDARRHLVRACSLRAADHRPRALLADILFSTGRLKEASALYREAFTLAPEDTGLLLKLGIVFKALGQFKEAGAYLDRALMVRPDDPHVHLERGYYFLTRSLPNEAREALEKALSLDANLDEARFRLGEVCFELGRTDEAVAHLEALTERVPDHITAHRLLGIIGEEQKNLDRAAVHFRQVLMLKKKDLVSSLSLGRISFLKGCFREAAVHLERAVDACPASPEALTWLGRTRLALEAVDDAADLLRQAVEADPDSKSARFWLARSLQRAGRGEGAVPLLESLLDDATYAAESSLALGRVYLRQGRLAAAGEQFERVLRQRPGDVEALFHLGRMALLRDDASSAEVLLTRARESGCREPDLPELLSEVLERAGRFDEARRLCLEAFQMDRNHSRIIERLASIEEKTGHPARALAFLSRLMEIDPHRVSYMLRSARLLVGMERWDESLELLRRISAQDSAEPDLWRLYTIVYEKTGNQAGLEESLRRLLQLESGAVTVRERLAVLLCEQNRAAEALEVARDGFPGDHSGRLWRLAARVERARGNVREAARAWIQVCRRAPDDTVGRLELAEVLLQCGRYGTAYRLAEAAVKTTTQEPGRASFVLGSALVARGTRPAAAPWFRKAAEAGYRPEASYLELGRCFMEQNASLEAYGILSRAVELQPRDPEARFALAEAAASIGRSADALTHLEALDKLQPDHMKAMLLKGRLFRRQGSIEQACKAFSRVVRTAPGNADVLSRAARFFLMIGRFKQALDLYRTLASRSKSLEAKIGRAKAALAMSAVSEALAVLESIPSTAEREAEVCYLRGAAAMQSGDFKTSAADLERAIVTAEPGSRVWEGAVRLAARLFEREAAWSRVLALREELSARGESQPFDLLELGDAAFHAGHIKGARRYYNRYADLRGNDFAVMIRKSRLCRAAGNIEDALGYLRRSLAIRPYDTGLAREMVEVFRASGRIQEARDLLESLVDRFPDDSSVRIELGQFCLQHGDYPAALLHFNRASLSGDAPASIHRQIGAIRFKQGDAAGAEKVLTSVVRHDPHDEKATCLLADVLMQEGKALQAFKLLRRFLYGRSDCLEASLRLADICRRRRRLTAAHNLLQVLLNEHPDNADIHLAVGGVTLEMDDLNAALDHLQRACSLRPGHVPTLRLIGRVYRDIGLTNAALDTYGKIIQSGHDDVNILFEHASLLAESGKSGEAMAAYQKLVRRDPENVEAIYNLGLVYNSEGLLDKAVECYRQVVDRAVPGSPVHRLASEMIRPRRVSIGD